MTTFFKNLWAKIVNYFRFCFLADYLRDLETEYLKRKELRDLRSIVNFIKSTGGLKFTAGRRPRYGIKLGEFLSKKDILIRPDLDSSTPLEKRNLKVMENVKHGEEFYVLEDDSLCEYVSYGTRKDDSTGITNLYYGIKGLTCGFLVIKSDTDLELFLKSEVYDPKATN